MPVTWNDQAVAFLSGLLLQRMGKIPINEICQDWTNHPNSPCEAPTPKALTLQISKMRSVMKSAAGDTPTSTPAKTPRSGKSGPSTPKNIAGKKRKATETGLGDDEGNTPPEKSTKKTPTKKTSAKKETPKPEKDESEDGSVESEEDETPVKKEEDDLA